MKSHEAVLIVPTQLFEQHELLDKKMPVLLVEFPRYFSAFTFHKQKLMLHRATMQMYKAYLKKKGYTVIYLEHSEADTLPTLCQKKKIETLHCYDPVDIPFEKELQKTLKKNKIQLELYETPAFLSSTEWLEEQIENKKQFRMQGFYIAQRKRLDVLVTKQGTPVGGKWSFDDQNRKPLPEGITIPTIYKPRTNRYVTEAKKYVQKQFPDNPGSVDSFIYSVTFATAHTWLDDFLQKRFKEFGPYEDAIDPDEPFLFHSLLSPLLNIGLLTPEQVLNKTIAYAKKHKIPINSYEGFIRQLIGWREYVRGVYIQVGNKQRKGNFFKHRKRLPASFWDGTTGIEPIDSSIELVLEHAYAHHIVRLMILGNFMLLCNIKPDDVYTWFMELFIDAYDWVMVPNVYGMSQYADGGLMTTKPYISGSNYVLKMSNFKKGDWCPVWDALYWNFIYEKRDIIKKTARLAVMNMYLKRMKKSTLDAHLSTAKKFLNSL